MGFNSGFKGLNLADTQKNHQSLHG